MRRKLMMIVIFVLSMGLFCSCSDEYEQTVISDIKLYGTIWNLSERRVSETSELFPNSAEIASEEVINFHCKHTTYQMVGTGWQVELAVKYNDDSFYNEVNRLSKLCDSSIICGESKYFDVPAYASVWNHIGCFEYAVVNEKDKTIGYIYLQLVDKDDLEVSSAYIPHSYEMTYSDSQGYTIYL